MIYQKEVNDCIIASVANYISLKTGKDAKAIYDNCINLIVSDERILSTDDYLLWIDGHGMPLEVIKGLAAHYGISLTSIMSRDLLDQPCIIVIPVDHLKEFKYNCHVIIWTGAEVHDPVQFKTLRTTKEDLIDLLPRAIFYIEQE